MKTILVPVDFSTNSYHAARYALELAQQLKTDLILLNVYAYPVIISEVPVQPFTFEEIEEASITGLRKFAAKLKKHNSERVSIKLISIFGEPGEEILKRTDRSRADMIIMGAEGQTTELGRFFGNTTTTVCRKSSVPVLVVPPFARLRPILNIMIGCDASKTLTDPIILALRKLSSVFDARLTIVQVLNIAQYFTHGGALPNESEIHKKLGDAPHGFRYEITAEAVDGILKASKKNKADLLVLISHQHDLVNRIFHGTVRRLIHASKKPILVLPENISTQKVKRILPKTANAI